MPCIKKVGEIHDTLTGYEFGGNHPDAPLTPVKAIRAKCLECVGGSSAKVDECEISDCTLWPYRKGKRPNHKGRKLSEEQRKAASERMKHVRKRKAPIASTVSGDKPDLGGKQMRLNSV